MYSRPICVGCMQWMKRPTEEYTNVPLHVGVHKGHIHADVYECPECKKQIITNYASGECFCNDEPIYHIE